MMMLNRLAALTGRMDRLAPILLPIGARLVFGAVLVGYFWASGLTKVGPGVFGFLSPSSGAYAQIFPKAFEAAGYNTNALGLFHWAVVVAGTVAEFALPLMILLGALTRLAALGMIGFIVVQSLTDVWGHMAGPQTIGLWFDRIPDAQTLDQRALWVLLLAILVLHGAGAWSIDRLFHRSPAQSN